jgi:hypothetical protein
MKTCNQVNCAKVAAYRFMWPGWREQYVCEDHADKLRSTANAMGFALQIIPLAPDGGPPWTDVPSSKAK